MRKPSFSLTINVPQELKPWVDSLKAQGFVLSRVIVALMLAERERQEPKKGKGTK